MSELKPCPFCGGEAMVNTLKWIDGYTATALCKNEPNTHHLETWDEDEAKAVERITEAWNTRAERTCRVEGSRNHDYGYAPVGTVWEWDLSCGDTVEGDDPPDYCPKCGAKVVSE